MSEQPARVAVLGPTASGKSAVAMAVAEQLGDVELVSIDSMQVYRGMDVGTAKPTPDEQARIPHHLIDLVDATESFSVAEFQGAYRSVVADLRLRGRRAVLVGGTGLYHRAAIDDLDLPGEWPDIRTRLQADADRIGPEELHAELAVADPDAAARMESTNTRRIVRALEVIEGSGRRFSSFGPGLDEYPASPVVQIGVRWVRDRQAARIEHRVHLMMADGLLDEVEGLAGTGLSRTAAQALGYKELLSHLAGDTTLDDAVQQVIIRTRQFAVRQLRWFQRDPRVRWVDVEDDPVAEAGPAVIDALNS